MPHHTGLIRKVYLDPLFERTLRELRARGGYDAAAAGKADAFISSLCGGAEAAVRGKFRFTRKGEHRIRNCRKVDLGCGYRMVCVQKDQRLVLLYVGTHDECFRWIARHRTAEYDLDAVPVGAWTDVNATVSGGLDEPEPKDESMRFIDAYEDAFMERIDDAMLRRVFAGIVDGHKESAAREDGIR